MGLSDLTVIYLTANEVPEKWAAFQMMTLYEAAKGSPIISMSRKPIRFGENHVDQQEKSIYNIYLQMLCGARYATTPFVAIAEDDVLYAPEHFSEFRPPADAFAYDMNRLGLFTWSKKPMYFWKNRVSNSMLIAPRELMIEALEERFDSPMAFKIHGELGRNNIEDKLGITRRKKIEFFADASSVRIDHDFGYDHAARHHRKKEGPIKAYDVPGWGRAEELIKKFV